MQNYTTLCIIAFIDDARQVFVSLYGKEKLYQSWQTTSAYKSQKGLPLETKPTQSHEIEDSDWLSLFTVVCEAAYSPIPLQRRRKRYSILKITRMGPVIPKEIKYNLHYDNVRGDFLRPPHGSTPDTVE